MRNLCDMVRPTAPWRKHCWFSICFDLFGAKIVDLSTRVVLEKDMPSQHRVVPRLQPPNLFGAIEDHMLGRLYLLKIADTVQWCASVT